MPHDATDHLMEAVIEAYGNLLRRLTDSVYSLFTALGFITLYIAVIAALPVVCLLTTFYIIATSLIGVTSRQEADPDTRHAAAELQRGETDDIDSATTLQGSLADMINESFDKKAAFEINDHFRDISTEYSPAIPSYLSDCEFFYSRADPSLHESSDLILQGKLQVARLTMDGESVSSSPESVMMVLKNLERGGLPVFREEEGVVESKRGMLELGIRVYVGPTEWLLRVLQEATW